MNHYEDINQKSPSIIAKTFLDSYKVFMKKLITIILFSHLTLTFATEDTTNKDFTKINDLLPSTYYLVQEKNVPCSGNYRGTTYDGTETSDILDINGNKIDSVCTRFYNHLVMEGSGRLNKSGRKNNKTISWAGNFKFKHDKRCQMGAGVSPNYCLLAHHTIAADNKHHQIGDVIYIPSVDGLKLPDGTTHWGFFIVLDTGGGFIGIGDQRVDLFVGLEKDYKNIFKSAGLNHQTPIKAFKVTGEKKQIFLEHLEERFGSQFKMKYFKL